MAKTSRRKPAKRTAVVVLSMHRSGTSALTRVLSLLGCTLPQTLIAGRKNDNDTGFWESQAVVDVNEAICASTGSNWNDWVPLSHGWLSSPVREGFVDQAHEVLESEFGDSRLFVLKDPRLCRLMPVWADALELFKARSVYVLSVRNPFEVAASLRKRNQLIEGDSHLAWLRHMLDAERHSRGQPRVFVRYDDLLGNWRKVVDRISDKLDLPWPNRSVSAQEAIDAFLAPDLRHHSVEDARVFEDAHLLPWMRQCFDVMSRWTRDEARDDDLATLDRINAEMDAVVPAFESIVAETRALGKKRRELAKRLEVADAAASEQRKALEAAQAERDRSVANLGTARGELEKLRSDLAERDKRLQAADVAAREQREALEAAQAERGQSEANVSTARGELEKLRAELTERDKRLEAAQAERDQGKAELGTAQAELTQLRDRLSQADSALGQRRAELDETTGELEELRAELMERDERLRNLEARRAAEQEEARVAIYRASQEASNRLAEQEARANISSREIAFLSNLLLASKDENRQLLEKIAGLDQEHVAKVASLSEQIADLDREHVAKVASLSEQMLAAEDSVRRLQAEHGHDVDRMKSEINEWKEANEILARQVEDLKQSTSWRITAPARGLSTAVRSLIKRPQRKRQLLLGNDRQ